MRWVHTARLYPQRCAVWPHVGATHPAGYIDTLQTTPSGERIYLSLVAANAIAAGLGFVKPKAESELFAKNKRLEERVAELEREVAAASGQLEAVHTLRLAGATAQAKPGRKPAEKAKAVA